MHASGVHILRIYLVFAPQISIVPLFLFLGLAECAGGHGAGHIHYRFYRI
jgi:hypothetical protein